MRQGPPLRVLVTGAAGLIGSELCGQLCERGHGVVALVHRSRRLVRNDGRITVPLPYSGASPEPGNLLCVTGDVCQAGLGLPPGAATVLASGVDLVVHCAAETGFGSTPDLHRNVNVDGTANVVGLAQSAAGLAPGLVHVSTAYVSGERSGFIAEEHPNMGQGFANAYEESKAEAERVVSASGLKVAIARPSIVVGTSDTGAIGRFENIYGLLKLIGSGKIRVLPAAPGATLDLVPIDHVISGLIDLVERFHEAAGRTFHLVSGDPAPVAALAAVDYPGFHVPRLVRPETFDPALLDPAERWLYGSVTSLYAAYLRRDPRFSTRNLHALSGRSCPPTGPGFFRRIVNYASAAKYLRPKPAAERNSGLLT